jgi:molecular chaperone HscB
MTGAPREPADASDPFSKGDPFDLLGIDPSFDIDLHLLRPRVRRRIAALHPDRFSDPVEIDRVTRESARLNAAWKFIEDEERRANLVLVRFGGSAAEDDRSLPPEFLQEMLSTRMELEEAIETSDSDEIARLSDWAGSMKSELRERVREGLASLEKGQGDMASVRLDLNVWRYIQRMSDELASASDSSEPEG